MRGGKVAGVGVNRARLSLAGAVLAVHALLLAFGSAVHSPSNGEIPAMAAGIRHWQTMQFDLFQVNPPLIRMWATLPVLLTNPRADWTGLDYASGARPECDIGTMFIRENADKWRLQFFLARCACIPISLLGAVTCFLWAHDLYGWTAGLLALVLWCFCPIILGNAQMITPDVGAAAFGLLANYCFWRWLRKHTFGSTFCAAGSLGLAQLTKLTWIMLFVLWPLLWVFWMTTRPQKLPRSDLTASAAQLAFICLVGVFVVNLGYAFTGFGRRLGDFGFVSESLGGPDAHYLRWTGGANRFAGTVLGSLPIPFPADYASGIDVQKGDFEREHACYFRGQWSNRGRWYYYLYGLGIKTPLGVLSLFAMAVATCAIAYGGTRQWRDDAVLLVLPLSIVLLVSGQTAMNCHFRYILPAVPFLYVWLSGVAGAFKHPVWRAVVAGLTLWAVASSLWACPHSLAYCNELVGGPSGGAWHLNDSCTDWGQDLQYLKRWLDEHPEARPLGLAHCSYLDPSVLGIEYQPVLAEPLPGWYAISVNRLNDESNDLSFFNRCEPVDRIGFTFRVYHLDIEQVNTIRQQLGLTAL